MTMILPQGRNGFLRDRFRPVDAAGPETVVLVDVDSAIPNLALMKLSKYFKSRGRRVILVRDTRPHRKSRQVFASCVFDRPGSRRAIAELRLRHGDCLRLGGSGADLSTRLPEAIESLPPDYSLYPGTNFAMGFLTRGCPRRCGFCIVPRKDGRLRAVADLDSIVPRGWNRLVLLDDNILAYRGADELLREMADRRLQVNFNQTLDIRCVTVRNAPFLMNVDSRNYYFTRRMYYFSLNSAAQIGLAKEKLRLLHGIKPRQMTFVCMYGFNTTLSDDIARFGFLQRHRISPFVQRYQPPLGASRPGRFDYFDCNVAPLARMHFPQNGRNFECYLKWVSRSYVRRFGKIHRPLVDRIFQYNFRERKRQYIDNLLETVRLRGRVKR
ncbi:MAG: hypothetical protein HY922_12150 [Elusimicrobia bacterium]|nr:hypothetical protein [Elusimicrobiota bacterium]